MFRLGFGLRNVNTGSPIPRGSDDFSFWALLGFWVGLGKNGEVFDLDVRRGPKRASLIHMKR